MLNSGKIAEIVKGELYGPRSVPYKGCVIDSRLVSDGDMFIAMPGENTDGHNYISQAFKAGATIALGETGRLSESQFSAVPEGKALIAVKNSLKALQELAGARRTALQSAVIGVTGSSGKTTTKDMIAAVLAQKYKVHKNKENFNNEIGLPLTILNAPGETEIMVLEMGMRGPGQIRELAEICRPSLGVITNIGTTHIELLGSQEKIAHAKWELVCILPENGAAILNAEDFYCVKMAADDPVRKIFYGTKGRYTIPDISGINLQAASGLRTIFDVRSEKETARVDLPLAGEHNVLDALAALTVGLNYGISLKDGAQALKVFKLSGMRLEVIPGILGSMLINDVYNANPDSMKASLRVLAERGGEETIAVLGEMYELGDTALPVHCEVGREAASLGIKQLVTVGKLAEHIAQGAKDEGFPPQKIHICPDCVTAADTVKQILTHSGPGAWVLIKGSRGMKMERITQILKES